MTTADLTHYVRAVYPATGTIPPREGGLFFRELSDVCGIPESKLSQAAHVLGLWDANPQAILRACTVDKPPPGPDPHEPGDDVPCPKPPRQRKLDFQHDIRLYLQAAHLWPVPDRLPMGVAMEIRETLLISPRELMESLRGLRLESVREGRTERTR